VSPCGGNLVSPFGVLLGGQLGGALWNAIWSAFESNLVRVAQVKIESTR
jgi:hypothetical protein